MSETNLEITMRHLLSELYAKRVNFLLSEYKSMDDDIAARFIQAIEANERKMLQRGKSWISAYEDLNNRCLMAWSGADLLDFSKPQTLEVFALIFIFIEKVNAKFKMEIALMKGFDPDIIGHKKPQGGNHGNQTNN